MKTLWPYQVDIWEQLRVAKDDVAVEAPTGSGKTVEIVAVAETLRLDGRRVLIATPQEHIEQSFVYRDYHKLRINGSLTLEVPADRILDARQKGGTVKTVKEFVTDVGSCGHSLVCTHATLAALKPPTDLPEDLSGHTLFVDEAHHSTASGLSQLVHAWRRVGGQVHFFSATMYRGDDEPVCLDGMRVIRRPMPLHMEEGYAPRRIEFGINAVRVKEKITHKQFVGQESPASGAQQRLVAEARDAWLADGRPKLIVRVPPLVGGTRELVTSLVKSFEKSHARVLDVTGSRREDKNRFLDNLRAERELHHYDQSKYDVVIGVQRVAEGLDWPWCSAVYCVGLPNAIATVVQLLGRSTRKKHHTYPSPYHDKSLMRFIVPCGDRSTLQGLPQNHARRALLICSYLANSQTAGEWTLMKEVDRGVRHAIGKASEPLPSPDTLVPYIDPVFRAETELAIVAARETLQQAGRQPSPFTLFKWMLEHRPDINRAVLTQILVEQLVSEEGDTAECARTKLRDSLVSHLKQGTDIGKAIRDAFDDVLGSFISVTLVQSNSTSVFERHLHALDSGHIVEFAKQLAVRRPITVEWLTAVVRKHYETHHTIPFSGTPGHPLDWPEDTWWELDRVIRQRDRGWSADYPSLHAFASGCILTTVQDEASKFVTDVPELNPAEREVLKFLLAAPASNKRPIGECPMETDGSHGLVRWTSEVYDLLSADKLDDLYPSTGSPWSVLDRFLIFNLVTELFQWLYGQGKALSTTSESLSIVSTQRLKALATRAVRGLWIMFRPPLDDKAYRPTADNTLFKDLPAFTGTKCYLGVISTGPISQKSKDAVKLYSTSVKRVPREYDTLRLSTFVPVQPGVSCEIPLEYLALAGEPLLAALRETPLINGKWQFGCVAVPSDWVVSIGDVGSRTGTGWSELVNHHDAAAWKKKLEGLHQFLRWGRSEHDRRARVLDLTADARKTLYGHLQLSHLNEE